jgi:hypothetical protein
MPNIFRTIIVRRFLAHVLEIGTTFSISLLLVNLLFWFFNETKLPNILLTDQFLLLPQGSLSYETSIFNNLFITVLSFSIFYFIYTTFNFFFTFSTLYPKNNFEASFAQKLFGFKKYEFKNKKETHLNKAFRMVIRELLIIVSVYGVFVSISLFGQNAIYSFFNELILKESTFIGVAVIILNLFLMFVLPSLILSLIYMKISKGKQLFWDYYSGVTLK